MSTGQPQQPLLMDPAQLVGQPGQQMGVPDPQSQSADPNFAQQQQQAQFDYYQQFQPAPQQPQSQSGQPGNQPQPIPGTSFYTQEQMVEGYKNLQRLTAQREQELRQLQDTHNNVVQHALKLQTQVQQPAPPTTQAVDYLNLPLAQFTEKFNSDPTGVLNHLKTQIEQNVSQQFQQQIQPLQQQLQGTATHLNRQAVTQAFNDLDTQFSNLPNYNTLLETAVNKIVNDPVWTASANQNPAEALKTAFQAELGNQLGNPEFIRNLTANLATQAQTRNTQMMYAQPMTGATNPQAMPHQPLVNPNAQAQQQNGMIAHQIATYANQEYFNPKGPQFRVENVDLNF